MYRSLLTNFAKLLTKLEDAQMEILASDAIATDQALALKEKEAEKKIEELKQDHNKAKLEIIKVKKFLKGVQDGKSDALPDCGDYFFKVFLFFFL